MTTEQEGGQRLVLHLRQPLSPLVLAELMRAVNLVSGVSATTDYQPKIALTKTGLREDLLVRKKSEAGEVGWYVSPEMVRAVAKQTQHERQSVVSQRVSTAWTSLTDHMVDSHNDGNDHPERNDCPLRGIISRRDVQSKRGGFWQTSTVTDLFLEANGFAEAVDRHIIANLPLHRRSVYRLQTSPAYNVVLAYAAALRPAP